jgi:CDP-glucose 4,6-dehydratase
LERLGAKVTGYALDPTPEHWLYDELGLADRIDDRRGNLNDQACLMSIIKSIEPEIVVHMAAQAIVRESYLNPIETYTTNVIGTANLLDCLRLQPSVKAVLVVTSDKCYENSETGAAFYENDRLGGHDPYSSSKACAELVVQAFRDSFFREKTPVVGLATARAGNVIGGGDGAKDRLIPDAIRAFSKGQSLAVRNPSAIRPWQHVLDPLSGYLCLCEHLYERGQEFSSGWNFGPDEQSMVSVSDVLAKVVAVFGRDVGFHSTSGEKTPHEATLLRLDASKAKDEMGWQPQWQLDTAIEETISWYCDYLDGKDMIDVTARQIEEYERGMCS